MNARIAIVTRVVVTVALLAAWPAVAAAQDGSIEAWGQNASGQCNVPPPNTEFVAVDGGNTHSLGLKADGSIVAWGSDLWGQLNVPPPNTDFVAVAAGGSHNLGLKADGSIVAWGRNTYGQSNEPGQNSDFVAVAAGGQHSLGLKADGSIVAWGYNAFGQLNVPGPNTDFVAVAAGGGFSLGLKADGSIVAWGKGVPGQLDVPDPNSDFVAVSAGSGPHILGLKADGSIVAWGSNSSGQLNVPDPNTDFVAVAAGEDHSLGLKADGSIVAWGQSGLGQIDVPAPNTDFIAVAAGYDHSLGLKGTLPVTTVITHGFKIGSDKPGWVASMAEEIVTTAEEGKIFRYIPTTGEWNLEPNPPGVPPTSQVIVLRFNWAAESDAVNVGPNWGFAQAAGDALYAALRDPSGDVPPGLDLLQGRTVHFIGHSRGTSVNSEVVRRLALANIPVDQVTTLDPHPVNGTFGSCDWGDPIPTRWENATWSDNHFREDDVSLPCDAADPNGMTLPDAFNVPLTDVLEPVVDCDIPGGTCLSGPDCAQEHIKVHAWYHGSINGDDNDGTCPIESSWYVGTNPEDPACNKWNCQGFYYSVLGGGSNNRPPLAPPVADPGGVPSLYNGTFETEDDSSAPTVAGWYYHGGGWEGTVTVPPIVGFGSDTYAFLGPAGPYQAWAIRHNRFLLEGNAASIQLHYEVISASGDWLRVFLSSDQSDILVGAFPLDESHNPDEPHLFELPDAATRPGMYTLTFMLDGMDQSEAHVFLDNIVITSLTADNIHYVPSEFPTIQAAINAAVNGDEVVVADGVYTGPGNKDLDFGGKLITVRSENGPDDSIIDCEGSGRGFYFASGETADAVVDGFWIRNGAPTSHGGGIFINASSPTIRNCIVTGCVVGSTGGGGGIWCDYANSDGSSPTITNCRIESNTAWSGGGISCEHGSHAEITDCMIIDNHAVFGGGGLACVGGSNPIVTDCTFTGNSAVSGGGGGMFNAGGSNPLVTNCIFSGNIAADQGGAIWNSADSLPIVGGSSFCENTPDHIFPADSYDDGGGNCFADSCADTDGNGIPDDCECLADVDGDGVVGPPDLAILLTNWGKCPAPCAPDFNGDGVVGPPDLAILLTNWGPCP